MAAASIIQIFEKLASELMWIAQLGFRACAERSPALGKRSSGIAASDGFGALGAHES